MSEKSGEKRSIIPALFIEADNIPQAHYRATKRVFEEGIEIRTQYDRKNEAGEFIDPPSRDATVTVFISNPFAQPRYPVVSYCEIGKYIAEILGVKDHLVVPFDKLKQGIKTGNVPTIWPYTYSQRLTAYPLTDGETINQLDLLVDRLAVNPITRRAVATTRVPEVDNHLKEDLPCLGEVHLRCTEDEDRMYLHMRTFWRSRDLFKAWHDNVIALTFLQQILAHKLEKKTGREVAVGSYCDISTSLHLYGQDITEKGVVKYIELGEEKVLARAMNSQKAAQRLVIPQLEKLVNENEQWKFGDEQINQTKQLIEDIKSGRLIV